MGTRTVFAYVSDCPSDVSGTEMYGYVICDDCGLEFRGRDVRGEGAVCLRCELAKALDELRVLRVENETLRERG